jgi:hypothetical protein
MPFIAWSATSQTVSEPRAEFVAPASHRLVGNDDTAFRQELFDIAQTEAGHVVQPDGVADDLAGERLP